MQHAARYPPRLEIPPSVPGIVGGGSVADPGADRAVWLDFPRRARFRISVRREFATQRGVWRRRWIDRDSFGSGSILSARQAPVLRAEAWPLWDCHIFRLCHPGASASKFWRRSSACFCNNDVHADDPPCRPFKRKRAVKSDACSPLICNGSRPAHTGISHRPDDPPCRRDIPAQDACKGIEAPDTFHGEWVSGVAFMDQDLFLNCCGERALPARYGRFAS